MLQWMGGGRRKVKTTKKSIQARQHQFFEQRRQQLRSQAVEELISQKPQENAYSLDIASLKNLCKLAHYVNDQSEVIKQCSSCTLKPGFEEGIKKSRSFEKNEGCEEGVKKSRTFEKNKGILCNNNIHGAGVYSRANVGTQWTPASAAAAAALSHNEPELCPTNSLAAQGKGLLAEVIDRKQEGKKSTSKQGQNVKKALEPKRPSRHRNYENFQILDFIDSSLDNMQQNKGRAMETKLNAEVNSRAILETQQTATPTVVMPALSHNKRGGYPKKTFAALREDLEAEVIDLKQDERRLKPKQAKKAKRNLGSKKPLHHQEYEKLEVLDLFNTSHDSVQQHKDAYPQEECTPQNDYSLGYLQDPVEEYVWPRPEDVDTTPFGHVSGRTLLKERCMLSLDSISSLPSPVYNICTSRSRDRESPQSIGFDIEESDLFSVCSDSGSATISYDMDDYTCCDSFHHDDDDLINGYSVQGSDGTAGSFQFRNCHDELLLLDDALSPDVSTLLFTKVRGITDPLLATNDSCSLDGSSLFSFT